MIRAGSVGLLLALVAAGDARRVPEDQPREGWRRLQQAFRDAAGRAEPAVVTIETVGGASPPEVAGRPGNFQLADGPTTGLIYRADGLILTSAFNFVRDPSVITVTLSDGRRFVATLLARDELHKLAMLQIDAENLPTLDWCRRDEVRVGMWAVALGRSFGGERSALSVGIVSALDRFAGRMVQTDSTLSPANYGGPLIELRGRVIGVCVPMGPSGGEMAGVELYDSGVGFAIPGWRIEGVASRLAQGENVRRGWIGVRIEQAESGGVRITDVLPGSPGQKAELQSGDVIVGIDDVTIRHLADLHRTMAVRAAGAEITLVVERRSDTLRRTVKLQHLSEMGEGSREGANGTATQPTSQPTP